MSLIRRDFVSMAAVVLAAFCLAAGAVAAHAAQGGGLYIFVNKSVNIDSLKSSDIKNIYLGKKTRWEDSNQRINCVTLSDNECLAGFVKKYVGRNLFQFENYWKKQIFTGKGQPPRSFSSHKELENYIATTPGAIGFSCSAPRSGSVKVITVH